MGCVVLAAVCMLAVPAYAQQPDGRRGDGGRRDRTEWFKEMSRYKAGYLADALKLTDEQKTKFVPVYEEFQNATLALTRDLRKAERELRRKGKDATDEELSRIAEQESDMKVKQAQLEREYFTKFQTILTPRQLFDMSQAERKFTRQLMDSNKKARRGRR